VTSPNEEPTPTLDPKRVAAERLQGALRLWHRGALAVLAGCALAIAFADASMNADAAPPRDFTWAALALGVGVVALRRLSTSPVMHPRNRVLLSIGALLCAALLGCVAVALAYQHGQQQTALMFTLAAAVFILRPPSLPVSTKPTSA